jgi:predicted dehydrogenase
LGQPGGSPLTELPIPNRLQFPVTYPDGRIAPFIRVIDHWVQNIDQGYATAPSLEEGWRSQQLMDLARQADQEQRWLNCPGARD